MPHRDKTRENRLRNAAKRQGLTLHRSPRRDPLALDYGKYWLLRDRYRLTPGSGITLDEIETYLNQGPR